MLVRKKPKINKINNGLSNDKLDAFSCFIDTLSDTHFNLNTFYNNMVNVKINEVDKFSGDQKTCLALYMPLENEIRYLRGMLDSGIMHELFHMATSVIKDGYLYIGFFQKNLKTGEYLGIGLTEGYTILMDKKYFSDYSLGKKEVLENEYPITSYFVSLVQDIVGEDSMEKMYSDCNLYTLVFALSSLTGKKSTFKFIRALDYINIHFENKMHPLVTPRLMHAINYANYYCYRMMIKHANNVYKRNLISEEDYLDVMNTIASHFEHPLAIGKYIKRKSTPIEHDNICKYIRKKEYTNN